MKHAWEMMKGEGPLPIECRGEREEVVFEGAKKQNLTLRHLGRAEESKQKCRAEKAQGIQIVC